ncbi:MAG: fatty acid desaturase [Burkholderiales bacterium]|nr:fatty acid desaturase [Burkholderiales bacterium]
MNFNYEKKFELNVRESMRVIPQYLQWILTWMTGKPLFLKEKHLSLPRRLDVLLAPIIALSTMGVLTQLAQQETRIRWIGIVVLWIILVGMLRKIQVTHLHHAIHNRLFDIPSLNKIYAMFVPSLILVQNGEEYRREHLAHHNANNFTTQNDADAAFLARLGFLPGRNKDELWINLWMTVFSPVFHFLFAKARLESILFRNKSAATVCAILSICVYFSVIAWAGLDAFLVAILIPMFFLYHASALLQFLTEHAWNVVAGSVKNWDEYKLRCWGRFCGEAFPDYPNTGAWRWVRYTASIVMWSFRMLVLHLPVRLGCLVSDLPAHDWHHLSHMAGQNSKDWINSIYLREVAIANGDIPAFSSRELWGMANMIEHQFNYLESIAISHNLPSSEFATRHDG